MGWTYRTLESLPKLYDIVGCAWPLDEDNDVPGPKVRPCLALQRKVLEDDEVTQYGALVLSYGSGEGLDLNAGRDFILDQRAEWKAARLHKPTCFSMDRIEEFVWC